MALAGLALLIAMLLPPTDAMAQRGPQWLSAWTVSHNVGEVIPTLGNATVRMIVRPTIAGESLRIKLENTRANTRAVFSAAFIGVSESGGSVVPGTNTRLFFGGGSGLSLAPGQGAWSDPIAFEVKAFERLTVSLNVTEASDVSMHALGLVTNYSGAGSRAAEASGDGFTPIPQTVPGNRVAEFPFYWLAVVDVLSSSAIGTIVAFGDSWVDGRCSTTDNGVVRPDLYQRWTDLLAARLASRPSNERRAVVNAGIAGNRIIPGGGNGPAALERFDRDVLERAGASHVFFLQGMNDIGGGATAPQIISAMQQIIDRAHAKGLRIIGGTLFPLARPDLARWTASMEAQRLGVNTWIRTQAKFDAVVDFDQRMSGGLLYAGNASLKPEFVCDDNVHPNARGYKAMAEFVDLGVFETGSTRNGRR